MAKHENSRGIPLPRRSALGLSGGSPKRAAPGNRLSVIPPRCREVAAHHRKHGELGEQAGLDADADKAAFIVIRAGGILPPARCR